MENIFLKMDLAGDSTFDRKGFGYGLGLAQMLDTTITIAGPTFWENHTIIEPNQAIETFKVVE